MTPGNLQFWLLELANYAADNGMSKEELLRCVDACWDRATGPAERKREPLEERVPEVRVSEIRER